MSIDFQVQGTAGEARAAKLTTRRGVIETPVFMPVGTAGTVKGIRFEELESPDLDARIILGNTYQLWLRPGIETIRAGGGLHQFIGWDRAVLTDSGGFQVWSLGALRKITEEGTEFRSHVDGSLYFLSPEVSMEVQAALGAEIAMAFDECAPGEATHDEARRSMELTLRWAQRSKEAFERLQTSPSLPLPGEARQALFGIVQGAGHLDLRRESLERTVEIGFDGYAIGGLSVGEEKHVMIEVIEEIAPRMANAKLVIAGSDNSNSPGYIESVRKKTDHPRIHFTGYVAEEDIPRIFGSASVLVLHYTSATGSSRPPYSR